MVFNENDIIIANFINVLKNETENNNQGKCPLCRGE